MKNRVLSVDVLRGLTMMGMTIVNNPGDWGHVFPPLLHAEWHGWTPTDWVFPFFLFLVGISIPLAHPEGTFSHDWMGKVLTRTMKIFSLGLFLAFFSKIPLFGLEGIPVLLFRLAITGGLVILFFSAYDLKLQFNVALIVTSVLMVLALGGFEAFSSVRIPGVLQRIAVVYFLASLAYVYLSTIGLGILSILLLVGYWYIMMFSNLPGSGVLLPGQNVAAWIDEALLPGHLYSATKTWDPEGFLSTLPAIVSSLLGILSGIALRSNRPISQKIIGGLISGVILVGLGYVWNQEFPINKSLWTSSYTLVMAGFAIWFLTTIEGLIYVFSDRWTKPFVVFGTNAITVFFFSGIIPRVLGMMKVGDDSLQGWLYSSLITPFFPNPYLASLAGALVYLVIWGGILTYFYRNRLIFKV